MGIATAKRYPALLHLIHNVVLRRFVNRFSVERRSHGFWLFFLEAISTFGCPALGETPLPRHPLPLTTVRSSEVRLPKHGLDKFRTGGKSIRRR